ncbi:MAG: GNAT family N-acetyltransferase, partial [Phycisphaerales bacterium]|nr:GNAT family N-acetyltransferase [Phycisphaerales bacterium]
QAPHVGINLDLIWASMDGSRVRQVALVAPGAGGTAMLFLAPPAARLGDIGLQSLELGSVLDAICLDVEGMDLDIGLMQGLPEPTESWASSAYLAAGFIHVGDLAYLRHDLHVLPDVPPLPSGVTEEAIAQVGSRVRDAADVLRALDRSYIDTLDCPELCGLRRTRDILTSHEQVGSWSPETWRLVRDGSEAEGCMLLNQIPELRSLELVYLGLGPALRGRGVGSALLSRGLRLARERSLDHVSCAVDRRNVPALRLYARLGFREVSSRLAYVRPLKRPGANAL